jgi:hypothetical protein
MNGLIYSAKAVSELKANVNSTESNRSREEANLLLETSSTNVERRISKDSGTIERRLSKMGHTGLEQ